MRNKATEILFKLIKHKNGVVVDSMTDKNLNYERSYGVSVVKIKEVANQYPKDNDLAISLFEHPVRECKIAAVFIADAAQLTEEQMNCIAAQIVNSELAEQVAMRLIPLYPNTINCILEWCKNADNIFLQKCGWMSLGWIAAKGNFPDNSFEKFYCLLNEIDFSPVHLRHAVIFALSKLSQQSKSINLKIKEWIEQNRNNEDANKQYVISELEAFLEV